MLRNVIFAVFQIQNILSYASINWFRFRSQTIKPTNLGSKLARYAHCQMKTACECLEQKSNKSNNKQKSQNFQKRHILIGVQWCEYSSCSPTHLCKNIFDESENTKWSAIRTRWNSLIASCLCQLFKIVACYQTYYFEKEKWHPNTKFGLLFSKLLTCLWTT